MKRTSVALLVLLSALAGSLLTMAAVAAGPDSLGLVWKTVLGAAESRNGAQHPSATDGLPPEFNKVAEAYHLIRNSFYDKEKVDSDRLIEGAIEGMIKTLEDPYTAYMDAKESMMFQQSLEDSFEGIGTEVMMLNNRVTVVSPFRNSPAEKAGIKPNDQIISVDGESIEGLELEEAVQKIRGPKGTKVKLGILRPGIPEPITIVVVRDKIPIETVHGEVFDVEGKKIGKIEITSFSENTAADFLKELKRLEREKIAGLVLDVRGNPGGYLETVLAIADNLVPDRRVIVQVEDRDGKKVEYRSKLEKERLPIAVLIDKGSASASEILAAALKSAGYPLVGENTFGKGTVQVTKNLSDGGSIKITVAKWLTPDGEWIHEKGVAPTVPVKQPDYFHAAPIQIDRAPLRKDTTGTEVKNLQLILSGLGFNPGRMDGYFSQETENAVRSFQKTHGLPATGAVDQATAEQLQSELMKKILDERNDRQLQTALRLLAE